MDDERLGRRLAAAFGGTPDERRVVVRAACDLAADGRFAVDAGRALSTREVVSNLSDAPAGTGVVERWNWWMGALDVAYGGYAAFAVREYRERRG